MVLDTLPEEVIGVWKLYQSTTDPQEKLLHLRRYNALLEKYTNNVHSNNTGDDIKGLKHILHTGLMLHIPFP
jgi:uncharacterized protein YvpB